MSNLLASLLSSASTLEAYGRVLETAQNNVSNTSTPGYAKQRLDLYALPFDPQAGSAADVLHDDQTGHAVAGIEAGRRCCVACNLAQKLDARPIIEEVPGRLRPEVTCGRVRIIRFLLQGDDLLDDDARRGRCGSLQYARPGHLGACVSSFYSLCWSKSH